MAKQQRLSTLIPASVSFLMWFHQSRLPRAKTVWWKLRFSLRMLRHFRRCSFWISYVREVIAPRNPDYAADLFQQPIKPFYCHRLCRKKTSNMLANAHALAIAMFGQATYDRLLSGTAIELGHIQGIAGQYKIKLEFSRVPSRESVFSLKFSSTEGELIELGFFFDREGSDIICRVGVLQSLFIGSNLEKIRGATKDLHQLHPRAFLMQALRKLCLHYGVTKIEGISSGNHIWNAPQYKHKNNAESLKYDEIWSNFGGNLNPDGNFDLPVVQPERCLDSYPQKKWNLVRKKQKLLASMDISIPSMSMSIA